MKGIKGLIALGFALGFIVLTAEAQVVSWDVEYDDWSSQKRAVKEKTIIPLPVLREADVKYSKRIHRVIDTRQKINRVLTWDKNPFTKFLHEGVLNGDFTAYKNDSLFTSSSYTLEEVKKRGGIEMSMQIQDPMYPNDEWALIDTLIVESFEWYNIKKFRIMEDWIFDFKHSVFKPRIIAIAPLYQPMIEGILLPEDKLYWIYMEELRPAIANLELFNNHNDAARLSVEDFFQMRMFDSYIIKSPNKFDMDFSQFEEYKDDNLALLLKGEEIKNDLFIFEHDLWEY